MSIDEYVERYKKAAKESNFPDELLPTDEEYAKMFISHMVVVRWQSEENEKRMKKEIRRQKDIERFKKNLWKA